VARNLKPSNRPSSRDVDEDFEKLALAAESASGPSARADAQDQMVLCALPLADSLARHYAGRGIDTDDLLQVARMAMVEAVQRYRPGKGHGFTAYAIPTVTGALKRCFRDQGWSVRPPRHLQELRAQVLLEEERLRHALMREPDNVEIAAALGCCPLEVVEARACAGGYHPVPLDAATATGESLADVLLGAACPAGDIAVRDALGRALRVLTERQRLVLRLRFADELTQGQIAERIGLSQMQISRILRSVLEGLRDSLQEGGEGCARTG
jgi:RNA polymerase sigma-B factor